MDGIVSKTINELNTSFVQIRRPYESLNNIWISGIISQRRFDSVENKYRYKIFIPFTFQYALKNITSVVVQGVLVLYQNGENANGFQIVGTAQSYQGYHFDLVASPDAADISGYFCDCNLDFYY